MGGPNDGEKYKILIHRTKGPVDSLEMSLMFGGLELPGSQRKRGDKLC